MSSHLMIVPSGPAPVYAGRLYGTPIAVVQVQGRAENSTIRPCQKLAIVNQYGVEFTTTELLRIDSKESPVLTLRHILDHVRSSACRWHKHILPSVRHCELSVSRGLCYVNPRNERGRAIFSIAQK